jgi:aspartyl protease family protein
MGGVMLAAAWVVIIAVISMLFTDLLQGQNNPNQDVSSERGAAGEVHVRLRENRQGHYLASGRINDAPVLFLLDTGATDVSVPAELARRLGLTRGAAIRARTANGVITTWQTTLEQVQLGDIVLHDVRASINPGMSGHEVLLGMSFLRELDFVQRDGTLVLTHRQAG